jgi:pepF/M3 family oligoendopeptidase
VLDDLPRWEMSVVFSGLDASDYARAVFDLAQQIDALAECLPPVSDPAAESGLESVIDRLNAALTLAETLEAFATCVALVDVQDSLAQQKLDEVTALRARLDRLVECVVVWSGAVDVERHSSPRVREHAPVLGYLRERSQRTMAPAKEELAAALSASGGRAWARLYGNLTAQLTIEVEIDGHRQTIPASAAQRLAAHPARAVRRRAFEAELAAWEATALPLAAALNGIKGEALTVSRRRGWASPLEQSLFENRIDAAILEAMLDALRGAFPDFHRYLQAKARLLGLDQLAWYDLYAPVGAAPLAWPFTVARERIIDAFSACSARLGSLARRAFEERWIDAEPRVGKRAGGLTVALRGAESRIMVNYTPSVFAVRQLAHELGHAYHVAVLAWAGRTALQVQFTPGTLAETASIFAETLLRRALVREASGSQRLGLLDATLQQARRVLDHYSMVYFEQRLFECRAARELAVGELCDLVWVAQGEAYGDAVDAATLHPYMWAALPHFYSVDVAFMNYPYSFGLLFSLGLFAVYERDSRRFTDAFDEVLALTGLLDPATLAGRVGIDLRSPDFWHGSIDVIRRDIDEFVASSEPEAV